MNDKKRKKVPKVDMSETTNDQLNDIVEKRKAVGAIVATKKGVVAEGVLSIHKRECKFSNKGNKQSIKNDAPYGYCPICGNLGITRERRIDGYDTCSKGHKYKSKEANQPINQGDNHGQAR